MPSLTRRLANELGGQVVGRLAASVVGTGTVAICARYLGPSDYGQLTTAFAWFALFTVLADAGLNSVVLRRATQQGVDLIAVVRISLGATCLYAPPLAVMYWAMGLAIYSGPEFGMFRATLPVYGFALMVACFTACLRPMYQDQLRLKVLATCETAASAFGFVLAAVVAGARWPAVLLLVSAAGVPFWTSVLTALGQKKLLHALAPHVSMPAIKSLVREAMPLTVVLVVSSLYLRVDAVLVASIAGTTAAAAYGLAYRVISIVGVVSTYLAGTVFSPLSRSRGDHGRYVQLFTRTFCVAFLFGALLCLPAMAMSGIAVRLLAGPGFETAVPALQILLVGTLGSFLVSLTSTCLIIQHLERKLLRLALVLLALNVVGNLIMIPRDGAQGAAAVTAVTELVNATVGIWLVRADFDRRLIMWAGPRMLLATVVLGLGCFGTPLPAFMRVAIGLVGFGIVVWRTDLVQLYRPTQTLRGSVATRTAG